MCVCAIVGERRGAHPTRSCKLLVQILLCIILLFVICARVFELYVLSTCYIDIFRAASASQPETFAGDVGRLLEQTPILVVVRRILTNVCL